MGSGAERMFFHSPRTLLDVLFRAAGQEHIYQRLAGSLIADPSALMTIGWTPPLATSQGLASLMQAGEDETRHEAIE